VTTTGRLVPGHEDDHARRLRAEGVAVADGRVVAGATEARVVPDGAHRRVVTRVAGADQGPAA
jgi:hypothetical protein